MTIHKQAEKIAKRLTGVNPEFDGSCLNYEGTKSYVTKQHAGRIILQYRYQWKDWVGWIGDQLEATLLGSDERFIQRFA